MDGGHTLLSLCSMNGAKPSGFTRADVWIDLGRRYVLSDPYPLAMGSSESSFSWSPGCYCACPLAVFRAFCWQCYFISVVNLLM